jgi:hypothetical protein
VVERWNSKYSTEVNNGDEQFRWYLGCIVILGICPLSAFEENE